jgi:Ca2+/Na+ antiporter
MVDVALQMYVFKTPETTHEKFLRRCLCKMLATVAIMIVMAIVFNDDDTRAHLWDCLIVATVVVLVLFLSKMLHNADN